MKGSGPGFNGPLGAVAQLGALRDPGSVTRLVTALQPTPGHGARDRPGRSRPASGRASPGCRPLAGYWPVTVAIRLRHRQNRAQVGPNSGDTGTQRCLQGQLVARFDPGFPAQNA